jgi:hypothetical protein
MALLAILFGLSFGGWTHADKLVVFQNGRTLRVQNVRDEGLWLYLTLGKKSEMGVLSRLIVGVSEIDGSGDGKPAPVPNVQSPAGGSGGGQSPGALAAANQRGGSPGGRAASAQQQADVPADAQAEDASRARSDALARAAQRASTGRVGRVPPSGNAQEQPPGDPGSDLGGSSASGGWRSLLENRKRGRSQGRGSGTNPESEENPDR